MGRITIEEMEFYAFHGHYQEEQIVGNRFLVDSGFPVHRTGRNQRS